MLEKHIPQFDSEQRINDVELAHLGALVVETSMRPDLDVVIKQQRAERGVENPNSVGSSGFFVGGEVSMSDNNVYRQVGAEAVDDLAANGIVRNGATANGQEHPRWGDRVFWHPGDGQKKIATGGRMIIEADKSAAQRGWVTADKVKGVYAKDVDGQIKNLLPNKEF